MKAYLLLTKAWFGLRDQKAATQKRFGNVFNLTSHMQKSKSKNLLKNFFLIHGRLNKAGKESSTSDVLALSRFITLFISIWTLFVLLAKHKTLLCCQHINMIFEKSHGCVAHQKLNKMKSCVATSSVEETLSRENISEQSFSSLSWLLVLSVLLIRYLWHEKE